MRIKKALSARTLFDIALGVAASAAAVTSASAQPLQNWTGFYIGAHAGYRSADGSFTSPGYSFTHPLIVNGAPLTVAHQARNETYGLSGGIFGAHAGYNFMLTPIWLVGIESSLSHGKKSGTRSSAYSVLDGNNDGFAFRGTSTLELGWQATIRGRLGVVSGPWLFYGTGGVAFTRVKWTDSSTVTAFDLGVPTGTNSAAHSATKTLAGGVVGAGIEFMFTPNWIGRVEYLYEHFGSFNVPHGFGPQTGKVDIDDVQKVLVGFSYRFGP